MTCGGAAGLVALATGAAGIAEAAYGWSRPPADSWVTLVYWFYGFVLVLVLVLAAFGSAMGWVLQWKGPRWSRVFGRCLIAAAAFVVLMWTTFLPGYVWR